MKIYILYFTEDRPEPPTQRPPTQIPPTEGPTPGLEVIIGQPQVSADVGGSVRLECTVRGTARVVDIRWTRVGAALPPGICSVLFLSLINS